MIGFYVYPGGVTPNQNNLINKETIKFIPWNEITETICLDANPDGYIIMPATYEANCTGPFILSVSTDVDFSLNDTEWMKSYTVKDDKVVNKSASAL